MARVSGRFARDARFEIYRGLSALARAWSGVSSPAGEPSPLLGRLPSPLRVSHCRIGSFRTILYRRRAQALSSRDHGPPAVHRPRSGELLACGHDDRPREAPQCRDGVIQGESFDSTTFRPVTTGSPCRGASRWRPGTEPRGARARPWSSAARPRLRAGLPGPHPDRSCCGT